MNSPIKFIEILKRENNSIYIKYEIDWDMPETMEDWWDYEEAFRIIEKHLNKLNDNLNIFEYNYDLTSIRIYPLSQERRGPAKISGLTTRENPPRKKKNN
jgi:hypothetical protein